MDVANGVFHVVGFANYALLYGTSRRTETLHIYKYNDGIWRLVKKKGGGREYDVLYEAPYSAFFQANHLQESGNLRKGMARAPSTCNMLQMLGA